MHHIFSGSFRLLLRDREAKKKMDGDFFYPTPLFQDAHSNIVNLVSKSEEIAINKLFTARG